MEVTLHLTDVPKDIAEEDFQLYAEQLIECGVPEGKFEIVAVNVLAD